MVPEVNEIEINWSSWEVPAIFRLIQETGNITDSEMRKVFNMGIGLIAVVDQNDVEDVERVASSLNEKIIVMGKIV